MIPHPYIITEQVRRIGIHFAALDRAPLIIDNDESEQRNLHWQREQRVAVLTDLYNKALDLEGFDGLVSNMTDDRLLWLYMPQGAMRDRVRRLLRERGPICNGE